MEDELTKIGWTGSCRATEPVEGRGFPLMCGGRPLEGSEQGRDMT